MAIEHVFGGGASFRSGSLQRSKHDWKTFAYTGTNIASIGRVHTNTLWSEQWAILCSGIEIRSNVTRSYFLSRSLNITLLIAPITACSYEPAKYLLHWCPYMRTSFSHVWICECFQNGASCPHWTYVRLPDRAIQAVSAFTAIDLQCEQFRSPDEVQWHTSDCRQQSVRSVEWNGASRAQ